MPAIVGHIPSKDHELREKFASLLPRLKEIDEDINMAIIDCALIGDSQPYTTINSSQNTRIKTIIAIANILIEIIDVELYRPHDGRMEFRMKGEKFEDDCLSRRRTISINPEFDELARNYQARGIIHIVVSTGDDSITIRASYQAYNELVHLKSLLDEEEYSMEIKTKRNIGHLVATITPKD